MPGKYNNLTKEQLIARLEALESRKKYGLVWEEERVKEQFEQDAVNSVPVLKEVKSRAIASNPSQPTHILIEGDNYHALTVLNYTHQGKVDVIYIDPPYNTGNKDFKYNDSYVDKEDGYRHSKWLSFMQKRLRHARQLLKAGGVILISIDNNEYAHLKILCDEIFSESNFIGSLIWRKKEGGGQADSYFVTEHEYVLVYKNSNAFIWRDEEIPHDEAVFNKEDALGKFKAVKLAKWGNTARREDRPKMYFPIKSPDKRNIYPIAPDGGEGRWRVGKKRMEMLVDKELVYWQKRDSGWIPYEKIYFDGDEVKVIKERSILYEVATTADGTNELTAIFGRKDVFGNPKPTELIKFCLKYGASQNAVVLDFFAGSGSTGHAVMDLNRDDGGHRQVILCTNNENNICHDVCHPRLKKVMQGYADKPALGGNLKYFKTHFIPKTANKDDLKIRVTRECAELLCLREGIFNEVNAAANYRVFEQGERVMAVYYSLDQRDLSKLKKELDKKNGEKILYCLTLDPLGLDANDFEDWDGVELRDIPKKILDIYEGLQ